MVGRLSLNQRVSGSSPGAPTIEPSHKQRVMVFLGLAFLRVEIFADPQRTRWGGFPAQPVPCSLERANPLGTGYGELRGLVFLTHGQR